MRRRGPCICTRIFRRWTLRMLRARCPSHFRSSRLFLNRRRSLRFPFSLLGSQMSRRSHYIFPDASARSVVDLTRIHAFPFLVSVESRACSSAAAQPRSCMKLRHAPQITHASMVQPPAHGRPSNSDGDLVFLGLPNFLNIVGFNKLNYLLAKRL